MARCSGGADPNDEKDPMEWTLANIVRTHAAERGGQPMLTYGARTITYAAMDAVSNRVAQALLAEGIGRQDRVAFLDKNRPEYFEVLFGGAKVNAVNVAVNWRLAPEEMERTIVSSESPTGRGTSAGSTDRAACDASARE